MPIATGYTYTPPQTLPVYIPPIDGIPAGLILMPTTTLGGQLLNSPITDGNGVAWVVTGRIQGWDAPDVRVSQTPRPNDHGLYNEQSFYGGRQLIVKGFLASTRGPAAAEAACQALRRSVNIVGTALVPLLVAESPPKVCMVKRLPGYKEDITSAVTMVWEMHLLAPDPRKYDPSPSTLIVAQGTNGTVINQGDISSRPMLTIQGPAFGIIVTNMTTAQSVIFAQVLGPSDVFTIDMDRKAAWFNGVSASYTVVSNPSQWWELVPGTNQIAYAVGSGGGAGTMSMLWRSSWIS